LIGKVGVELSVVSLRMIDSALIDVFLRGEVEFLVLPAITDVADGAEVVDDMFLAESLPGFRVHERPGPVLGFLLMLCRFRMTGQTGFGDFRAAGGGPC